MEYRFSKKALSAKPSPIRAISARGAVDPEFISFAIGNPAYETFPVDDIRRMNDLVYERVPKYALQYGPTQGDPGFIDLMKKRLEKVKGINPEGNDILVTTGSQNILTLTPMTLCDDGDIVLCEEFTYMGALSCMRGMLAEPYGVKVDEDGINLDALEEACKKLGSKVKYLYLIPNFQNPMGVTIPVEKRKAIYDLACKYDFMILEDDPYGELRYKGEPVPAIKSFDKEGRVLYACSFSKILASGIRLGYVCAPKEVIGKMTALKGNLDSGSPVSSALIARYFIEECDLDAHIEKTAALYGKKCAKMCECLDKYMSSKCKRTDPDGGMFLWVTIPEEFDPMAILDNFLENHIGVIPSLVFAPDQSKPGHSYRVCFATPTLEEIEIGAKRFGDVTKKLFGE
ncbi:MAG: PLP-dependent aminotransferase family protein [Clostridiales bacterium]|nr:PLP-dependent aminotransferase family protein [Clostridiales bacterium]